MNIQKTKNGIYTFGATTEVPAQDAALILEAINKPVAKGSKGLEGRVLARRVFLPSFGQVVIKEYRRGGLLGRIIALSHFSFRTTRSEIEFRALHEAASLGINIPKPICFVHTSGFIYSAWLVTEEIQDSVSLAELATRDEQLARSITAQVSLCVIKLIKARIIHVDLHPGNVLVGSNGKVYLIDFDKASKFSGSIRSLRDFFLCRWRRACLKHGLPEYVHQIMSLELRQHLAWKDNPQGGREGCGGQ